MALQLAAAQQRIVALESDVNRMGDEKAALKAVFDEACAIKKAGMQGLAEQITAKEAALAGVQRQVRRFS